jgi:hypothetical protein
MSEKASDLLKKHDADSKHKRHELTSDPVKHLAGKGLHDPNSLTPQETRELCASVLAHIARHHE